MKITIQKFQELNKVSQIDLDEVEKSKLLLKTLTEYDDFLLENMKLKKYNKLCKEIKEAFDKTQDVMINSKPKNLVKANGKWYWLNFDIAKRPMNAGKYVELATYSSDVINNLHKIMATMATPVRFTFKGIVPVKNHQLIEHESIAEDMLHLEFKHAYHSAVFFWAVFTKSIENSQHYFQSMTENPKEVEGLLLTLQELSVGFMQAKWYQNLKV
jgi:hypothetical protein